ncbi:MAG TPA: DUF362 domain-containing protein [Bacillota bacterium]|nr:DUF362 domain-containing protein [Bacillota bacterium]
MNRREFIKKGTIASVAGLGALKALDQTALAAKSPDAKRSEVIVAQAGEPEELLNAALKAFGGLQKLIKKGSNVVIKANFTWFGPPEQACDNNPLLVKALVKECFKTGAKSVKVVDMTIDPSKLCMDRSGIAKAVHEAGGEIMDLHNAPTVDSKSDFRIYKEALKADCLINLPILKDHSVTRMTSALKNYMGLTPDRQLMHAMGVDLSIVNFAKNIHPDLHIIDAYQILKTNGPKGPGRVEKARQLIVSHDPVAADTYAATLLGIAQPTYLKIAAKAGLGVSDLSKIKVIKVNA